jgi:5-carboxymethyl-2-hydroxymuconate isomerase
MPQITIEYSRNVESRFDVRALVDAVHEAARSTGFFDRGNGIRTRAVPRDVFRVADGDPENGFVAVLVRMAEGRTVEQRTRVADDVFAAVCRMLATASATTPLAISLEVQEIADLHARNLNNLHERLTGRSRPQKGAASQS